MKHILVLVFISISSFMIDKSCCLKRFMSWKSLVDHLLWVDISTFLPCSVILAEMTLLLYWIIFMLMCWNWDLHYPWIRFACYCSQNLSTFFVCVFNLFITSSGPAESLLWWHWEVRCSPPTSCWIVQRTWASATEQATPARPWRSVFYNQGHHKSAKYTVTSDSLRHVADVWHAKSKINETYWKECLSVLSVLRALWTRRSPIGSIMYKCVHLYLFLITQIAFRWVLFSYLFWVSQGHFNAVK